MANNKKKVTSAPVARAQLNALMNKMRVSAPQTTQRRQRSARRDRLTTPALGDAAMRYAHALTNPFSKEAEGVRVPEPYAVSTFVRKVRTAYVLTSSAAGGVDFAVQPHLVVSSVQTLGTATGGSSLSVGNQPAGVLLRSAVTFASLGQTAQTYRVVAIGVRIKTNVDFTKSGGRVYAAVMPASQELPCVFNSGTTVGSALACFEIPNDGTNISTNIVNMPRSFQFSVSELMSEGGVEVHFPICSARALDFIEAQSQTSEQHLTYTSVGTEFASGAGLGTYSAAGHSQLVIRGEGLEKSADVLTVETIYHVEGIPLVGSTNLIESTPHTPAPSSPNEIHLAHRIAAVRPVCSYVSEKLKELSVKRGDARGGGAAGMASRGVGAAERVLGLAARGLALM